MQYNKETERWEMPFEQIDAKAVEALEKLQTAKFEVMAKALYQKTGLLVNFEREKSKRFRRYKVVTNRHNLREEVYWDDGTLDGLHFISFLGGPINPFKVFNKLELNVNYFIP